MNRASILNVGNPSDTEFSASHTYGLLMRAFNEFLSRMHNDGERRRYSNRQVHDLVAVCDAVSQERLKSPPDVDKCVINL